LIHHEGYAKRISKTQGFRVLAGTPCGRCGKVTLVLGRREGGMQEEGGRGEAGREGGRREENEKEEEEEVRSERKTELDLGVKKNNSKAHTNSL